MKYVVIFRNAPSTQRMATAFRQVFDGAAQQLAAGVPPVLEPASPNPNKKPDKVTPIRPSLDLNTKEPSCSNAT